jgi:membrane protein YqaA with SNARE-associated domain
VGGGIIPPTSGRAFLVSERPAHGAEQGQAEEPGVIERTSEALERATGVGLLPLAGALALTVGISVGLVVYREPLGHLGNWGYPGAFLIMLVNNATVFLPALGHAFLAAAAQSLNPLLLGTVGGVGAALGELTGYALGRSGHRVLARTPLVRRLLRLRRRGLGPALFIFALTPLPFDVAGVIAGSMRYPIWRFLGWVCAGKILNTIAIAVASYYAIGWLSRLFRAG